MMVTVVFLATVLAEAVHWSCGNSLSLSVNIRNVYFHVKGEHSMDECVNK